ncbi:hypothetical protein HanIR_Chr13g0626221 [Helianthus annuus]|nr:hypothetical protein HanIR_Chr13g0626221 [Helianthus annuus]
MIMDIIYTNDPFLAQLAVFITEMNFVDLDGLSPLIVMFSPFGEFTWIDF